ncbi:DEAD/DEAH box helicase [Flavobacterium terrigena]|uniref:DEAD-box ATP-dependent RNA helicase RhpA n=1 Tax=Flavobacterium terrigena TaxID=402734 RepID=A0A1H6QQ08_9FLAO|nr:DEAD/DEAH box helicase [Flavobacterium terrigena]SEI41092.1 ATP-dependent RNA helicase RhlE [Flavobacterium terrigena]
MTFQDLNLHRNILQVLEEEKYTNPTPIQEQAIPIILEEHDLVGCAQTGTGKTGAFAIPILNYLHPIVGSKNKRKVIRTLVLAPTRELAHQIQDSFATYGKYMNTKSMVIYGGVSQVPQVQQLKDGVDILIATPGRFLDLNKQGFLDMDHLHHLVIDEADQMLDMGFINDVKKIIKILPDNRQTLLFSATMPVAIRELADQFLKKPKYVAVAPVSSTAERVNQKAYMVQKEDKRKLLIHLIEEENINNVLVFVRTKHSADNVVKALKAKNISAEAIHGNKSQNNRIKVLDGFKSQEISVLVATDIAARGIDIDLLPYVINFDLPNIPETYVHRIGRTGRAGNEGLAISFCSKDELPFWKDIEKLTRQQIKVVKDNPYPYREFTEDELKNKETDTRGKKNPVKQKQNHAPKAAKTDTSNSRKSDGAKKNKKRWY